MATNSAKPDYTAAKISGKDYRRQPPAGDKRVSAVGASAEPKKGLSLLDGSHAAGKDLRWAHDAFPNQSEREGSDEMRFRTFRLFEQLGKESDNADFSLRLWDGSKWSSGSKSQFTIVLNRPQALRAMFSRPSELRLAEDYIFKNVDIEGDLGAALSFADEIMARPRSTFEQIRFGVSLLRFPKMQPKQRAVGPSGRVHSINRDRQAISFHYDLSNEFYSLWLDKRMVYSCAYFENAEDDLDKAQEQKLDYICRKLRLKPGERLLDVGCGWGGLIMHAAANYGVKTAGITLSERQAKLAAERIEAAGLNDRCSVEFGDYREHQPSEPYDKIVSVGMFEHVGEKHLPEYFKSVYRLLNKGGVFLNHGIAAGDETARGRNPFLGRYVFPDGELVPIHTTLRIAESAGFEVRDVESLREHYALTLDHWGSRLESQQEQAYRLVGETTFRTWKLYLAGCAHAFRTRRLNLYQVLLSSNSGSSGLPLTRKDWYAA